MYGHFEIFFYTVMKQLYESRHLGKCDNLIMSALKGPCNVT